MLKKIILLLVVGMIALSAYAVPNAAITTRPTQIDLSTATSESAVLMTVSGYSSDDARYRLYNGSNQYNCWDAATGAYITGTGYAAGPQVPGTPTTSSTWWILFQRANNNTVVASYRDRLGTAYGTNYQTAALPTATSISTPVSITQSNVTFNTWNSYAVKYVVLAYDATSGGNLISATSSALTTGAFDLKVETGTTIRRIEVRDVLNNLIESVTGTWPSVGTPAISVTGTLNAFGTEVGTPSASQSYTLSGSNLTTDIVVTPPAGFAISTDNSNFSPNAMNLANNFNGSVYVHLTGTTLGTYGGNITHTSVGATQVDLAVSGEVTEPVGSTMLLEENFEYPAADLLTDHGWTVHSGGTTQPLTVANTNLSYPSYVANSGLSGQTVFAGTAQDVHKTFALQTSGSVYTSFLFNANAASDAVASDYVVHFGPQTIGTDFKGRFFVQKDANDNLRFGLTKAGAATSAVWTGGTDTYEYALNTTYLIVMKYVINSGAANDEVFMWVNPVIGATEPTPMLTASDASATDATNIGSFAIRQATNTPIAKFDGIRVSNDWAILWSGQAPPTPIIIVNGVPDPLSNYAGVPSEEVSSYLLNGTNLQGPISIVAPEGFEVSSDGVSGWASSIEVAADFNSQIYVRLISDVIGQHAGNITHNSPNAAQVSVRAEGETFPSPVSWNISANFTAFDHVVGTPSTVQSYTLSASGATEDITVSVASPFELSKTGLSGWNGQLTFADIFNGLVYVRMNSTSAGTFSVDIEHTSLSATPALLPVSGTATPLAGNYATDLFISEYVEGSSFNKYLEIFNGTGASVDLSDYQLEPLSKRWDNTESNSSCFIRNSCTRLRNRLQACQCCTNSSYRSDSN